MTDYSIIIVAKDEFVGLPVQISLKPLESQIFVAHNYPSFSKLVNEAIVKAKNETVIICSHKVRPTEQDVNRMLKLLEEGYGFVGLYRFAFFGFKKEVVRRIGFFDERYLGGGYEDCDYTRRLFEGNIALYESESVKYLPAPTSWGYNYNQARQFHIQKWRDDVPGKTIWRLLPEEKYEYDIGPSNPNIIINDSNSSHLMFGSQWCLGATFITEI